VQAWGTSRARYPRIEFLDCKTEPDCLRMVRSLNPEIATNVMGTANPAGQKNQMRPRSSSTTERLCFTPAGSGGPRGPKFRIIALRELLFQ